MGRPSKRQEIVEAAAQLVAERGLSGVSMRDVASAAGVMPASVYRQFPDKDALFEGIIRHVMDEARSARRDFLTGPATPQEKVKATVYYALHDSPKLHIHRRILLRAMIDRDWPRLEALHGLAGEQIVLIVANITALRTGRDAYYVFYRMLSLILGSISVDPLMEYIRPLTPAERQPLAMTDEILGMLLPEFDWPAVALIE